MQDGFVEALKQCLSSPDSSLVAQAIQTIAAVAKDGKYSCYFEPFTNSKRDPQKPPMRFWCKKA
jgi:hypothetical protein